MRLHDPYGFYRPARRPNTDPFKPDRTRLTREEWAEFCTNHCPHPGRQCNRGTCPEFRERFGKRKDA